MFKCSAHISTPVDHPTTSLVSIDGAQLVLQISDVQSSRISTRNQEYGREIRRRAKPKQTTGGASPLVARLCSRSVCAGPLSFVLVFVLLSIVFLFHIPDSWSKCCWIEHLISGDQDVLYRLRPRTWLGDRQEWRQGRFQVSTGMKQILPRIKKSAVRSKNLLRSKGFPRNRCFKHQSVISV